MLAFSALPALTAVLGATVAAFRPPPARAQSAIQHFAAGVVFAVVSVELLPDITRYHTLPATILGFAGGVALMLVLQRLTRRLEGAAGGEESTKTTAPTGAARFPTGLLVTTAVDVVLDGLLLGVAFAAGAREGTLLAVALATGLLSLGFAVSAALQSSGVARGRSPSRSRARSG